MSCPHGLLSVFSIPILPHPERNEFRVCCSVFVSCPGSWIVRSRNMPANLGTPAATQAGGARPRAAGRRAGYRTSSYHIGVGGCARGHGHQHHGAWG
jgi:hypothetical protein